MDSFELNKIIGAFLGVVFVVFSVSLLSEAIFHTSAPATPGYAIEVPDAPAAGGDEPAEAESVLPLLASADPSAGESVFRRCQACHTVDEGGANRVGPNLWDIVDAPVTHMEGFSYSAAMRDFAQGGEVTWTYENLDHFLLNPRGLIPGTAMSFAGLRNIEDRANVIAYLRSLSNDPAPLPEAAPAEAEGGEAAPAEGGAETAPAEEGTEAAPAEGGEPAAPAEAGQAAPAGEEIAPAEETEAPAQPQAGEEAAPEGDAAGDDAEDAAPAQ